MASNYSNGPLEGVNRKIKLNIPHMDTETDHIFTLELELNLRFK